jgi:hypothetical protein
MGHWEQLGHPARSEEAMSGPAAAHAPPDVPTPRAQMARVVVGATLAALLGAGPAVAWDVSTQLPRGEAPSHWPKPSPWRSAGHQVKSAAGGIARAYLPRSHPAPVEDTETPTPGPSSTALTPSTSAAAMGVPSAIAPSGTALVPPFDIE